MYWIHYFDNNTGRCYEKQIQGSEAFVKRYVAKLEIVQDGRYTVDFILK